MNLNGLIGIAIVLGLMVIGIVTMPYLVGDLDTSSLSGDEAATADGISEISQTMLSILPAIGIGIAALAAGGIAMLLLVR